jgi:fructokinase
MGGGVMTQPQLLSLVQQKVQASLKGYVRATAVLEAINQYIVPPALGSCAGVLGAIALGEQEIRRLRD